MPDELETQFMKVSVVRETTKWYKRFKEVWECSVAVDVENPTDDVMYSVRVIHDGSNIGETTNIEPEDVPEEVREKFREMFKDAAEKV